MIVFYESEDKDESTYYWACEYCGASQDGNAPAGKVNHANWCPEKTWEKRIEKT